MDTVRTASGGWAQFYQPTRLRDAYLPSVGRLAGKTRVAGWRRRRATSDQTRLSDPVARRLPVVLPP